MKPLELNNVVLKFNMCGNCCSNKGPVPFGRSYLSMFKIIVTGISRLIYLALWEVIDGFKLTLWCADDEFYEWLQ